MTFQGFLSDEMGVPLGNDLPVNEKVTFKVYRNATGAEPSDIVWGEFQFVTIDKGQFSVLLGEGSSIAGPPHSADLSGLFTANDASERWIGITVSDGVEISPRIRFFATPYAQLARRARVADSANGLVNSATGAGSSSVIAGGRLNTATGQESTVSGGLSNLASGENSTVPGGANNVASGKSSFAAGQNAKALHDGSFVWADSNDADYPSTTNNQFKVRAGGGIILDGPLTVEGNTNTVVGALNVTGATTMGSATVANNASISGNATVSGTLGVTGVTTLGGATVRTNASVGGTLEVTGATTLGSTTIGETTVNGLVKIKNQNALEFGTGESGKGPVAGRIVYNAFGLGALHIVGAGSPPASRNIQLWDHVGIGTPTPDFPLEVVTAGNKEFNLAAFYDSLGQHLGQTLSRNNLPHSIVAHHRMRAAAYDVNSDARIKRITSRTAGGTSLERIRQLQVSDYLYVDRVTHGPRPQRGLIAQEVEKIIPEAVGQSIGVVPDIYAPALSNTFDAGNKALTIRLKKPHGLKTDDVVSLVMESGRRKATVIDVPSGAEFVVEADSQPDKVFVFGRQVKDFRTVDYDFVFSTGISAIQELDRKVEALQQSEARIAELEHRASQVDSLENEVSELKQLVAQLVKAQTEPQLTAQAVQHPSGE